MELTIQDKKVIRCMDCPNNIEIKNKLPFFPPAHVCKAFFDESHMEGKYIFNPNVIPKWCPCVASK